MAHPTRQNPQAERRPPPVGKWHVSGPVGPTYEVVASKRLSKELLARFVFISRNGKRGFLQAVGCETVGARTTASITTRQLKSLPFDVARSRAWGTYSRAGLDELAWSVSRHDLPGAPKSRDEHLWLKRAVEYVAANKRDPRHVYDEMGKAFPEKTTLGQMVYWVDTCRNRRKLITPHPSRELTPKAQRLLKKNPITPWGQEQA